jgi:ubiquitin-protein ligase E3 C
MHHSFTGSSRKTRQINLSGRGRGPINAWASLTPQASTAKPTTGTQDALANAQAGRIQRQLERQKVTSARTIQRVWRGHASRKRTRLRWREQWDSVETQRLGEKLPLAERYEEIVEAEKDELEIAYKSVETCCFQLKLLVHFLDVKERMDRMRLLYFGDALRRTVDSQRGSEDLLALIGQSLEKTASFTKFGQLAAACIGTGCRNRAGKPSSTFSLNPGSLESNDKITAKYMRLLVVLGKALPGTLSRNAVNYFSTISDNLAPQNLGPLSQQAILDLVAALLDSNNPQSLVIYQAFARFLGTDKPQRIPGMLDEFVKRTDQTRLAHTLEHELRLRQNDKAGSISTESQLWQLAYFVYLQNHQDRKTRSSCPSRKDIFAQVLAILLSNCANDVAKRLNLEDEEMDGMEVNQRKRLKPLPPFIRQNIQSLAQQSSVAEVMSDFGSITASDALVARQLSKYAVALLRAFPSKATDIRMWLYQGSIRSTTKSDIPMIQYFWNAARGTAVFEGIYQTQRNALSLLKEPAVQHNQMGRPQPTMEDIDLWRDEWQIILLFLELYTFVLKLMDDEEFFSLQETSDARPAAPPPLYSRRGALPLADIAKMTVFLKNLAFTLYWNASDLADSNSFEDAGGLSAYFGTQAAEIKPEKAKVQSLAGIDGVSQAYLKGLVTGLLRMLHERHSRRKFLPDKHWLMTSHVDMTAFTPAVVAEEEKRQELGDDTLEEEGDLDETFNGDGAIGRSAAIDIPQGPFSREPDTAPWNTTHNPQRARTNIEAMQRKRELARKKRQIASLAPRIEILRNLPFFIPFETRVQIFREFVKQDQFRRREGHIDPDTWRMHTAMGLQRRGLLEDAPHGRNAITQHRAEVRRDRIFEDAFENFYVLGEGLKEPIQISFIDRFGNPEAGIDGGGVTKEFLTSITNEAFDPQSEMNMFAENDQHEIYPNPTLIESTVEHLKRLGAPPDSPSSKDAVRAVLRQFEFLGRVLGKCMYEGILVDINFAGFFLLKWALTGGTTSASNETAYRASINDVKDFDNELYQGLMQLKNYPGDVEADFALNFSVTDTMPIHIIEGQRERTITHTVTRDLIANGSNIAVTNLNRHHYIDRIARHRLQLQPALVTNAFLKGLGQIIQPMWMAMFNQKELQTLVGGENSELDIADLRRNTQYHGLYQIGDDGLEHPTIAIFWKVMREMSDEDRRKILKFVTSTPRAPLLGFSNLSPPFTIHSTSASEGAERLPSTSTCVNLLKLPNYRDERTMREKLLYAANSGAGFDLS